MSTSNKHETEWTPNLVEAFGLQNRPKLRQKPNLKDYIRMLKGINAVLAEGSGKGEEEAINAQDDDFVSRRVAVEYLEGKPFRFRRGGV